MLYGLLFLAIPAYCKLVISEGSPYAEEVPHDQSGDAVIIIFGLVTLAIFMGLAYFYRRPKRAS